MQAYRVSRELKPSHMQLNLLVLVLVASKSKLEKLGFNSLDLQCNEYTTELFYNGFLLRKKIYICNAFAIDLCFVV